MKASESASAAPSIFLGIHPTSPREGLTLLGYEIIIAQAGVTSDHNSDVSEKVDWEAETYNPNKTVIKELVLILLNKQHRISCTKPN